MSAKAKKGIDVSEHNGTLDWAKVKAAGMEFAILRTGYGKKAVDAQLRANAKGAAAQGIPYGLYHYSYALTTADAKQEAALVTGLLKELSPTYPVFFDMEDADGYKAARMKLNRTEITALCQTFVTAVQAAGYVCGVYANKSWLESYIDVSKLGGCPIWLAQWAAKPTWSGSYSLWQYSATGKITGLSGSFDLDYSYGAWGEKADVAAAVNTLAAAGVIQTPAYWTANAGEIPYLPELLCKLAAVCGSAETGTLSTVTEAVSRLAEKGALDSPTYWLAHVGELPYLDTLLIRAANHI